MHIVYLSLGTNLGDKEKNLLCAIEEIEKRIGPVKAQSAFLLTEPWGFESENTFLNAAVKVETELAPLDVLHKTQEIERLLGRTHKSKNKVYHDRIIDIDLLLYYINEGNEDEECLQLRNNYGTATEEGIHISTPELTLPHPLMYERDFVLIPLSEILNIDLLKRNK